ncbi:hypothetical protein ACROYT_G014076 [Oculina patagonica]
MDSSKSSDSSLDSSKWSIDEVVEKIRDKYDEDVAEKFREQKIDGKALKLLAREGSRAQYEACGLATVGDQLLLKDVVCSVDEVPVAAYRRSKKPTVLEVKSLSPLDQRVYKAKRKAVSEAAIANWPGNEMPNFKKDPAAKEELENLVAEIVPKCSYEPAGFDKASIRQHILDVINERRRRHRNGHDYTQMDKRRLKRKRSTETNSTTTGSDSSDAVIRDDQLEENPAELVQSGESDVDESGNASTSGDASAESDVEKSTEKNIKKQIPMAVAKVIVQVAFNAIAFKDVARKQLISCVKNMV